MKTSFYSTKRQSNVQIPNNKVCGARIVNSAMKNNYSDTVKADNNNGVVNQRLSRFSTEAERKGADSICDGNRNWLNHASGDGFTRPESAKNQFSIQRPRFLAGRNGSNLANIAVITPNQRNGLGNRNIRRDNFIAPRIKSRDESLSEFSNLQAMSVSQAGKINDKLLNKTNIQIPDATDFKWLRERARLIGVKRKPAVPANPLAVPPTLAIPEVPPTGLYKLFDGFPANEIEALINKELIINKPLGREQRMISSTTNDIARTDSLTVANKLKELQQEVSEGRAESLAGQQAITAQLILVLADTNAIEQLTRTQLTNLAQTLAVLGLPTTARGLGLAPRFISKSFYLRNAGVINLLLFSKVRENPIGPADPEYNYNLIVKNFTGDPVKGLPAIKLTTMVSALARIDINGVIKGNRYIDLERGGVIDKLQLRAFSRDPALGGFDGPNFEIPQLLR